MSRFQELVEERDRLRQDVAVTQERLRDLRIRLATLECALEFATPDTGDVTPVNPEQRPLKKAA